MSNATLLRLQPFPPPPPGGPVPPRSERHWHFEALLSQLEAESRLQALWAEHARIDRQRAAECDERDAEVEHPVDCEGWPSWGDRFRQSASAHDIQAAEAARSVELVKAELRSIAGLA